MAKLRAWRADAVPIAGSSHLVVGLTTMFAASACGTGGFADLGRNDQIFVVSADGDSFRRITDDDAANRSLAWSPDGQRLAFVASTQGSGAIETIRPDGHDRKMLLRRPTLGGELTWSPDGKRLTFSSYREEPNITSLETVDVDGTTPQLIASFVMPFVAPLGPSWSPDSRRLAYARSVGTGPPRVPPDAGPDAVAIIPGTFKIVVSGLRNHQRAQRLTQASGGEWDPRWIPRGAKILFTRRQGRRTALVIGSPGNRPSVLAAGFIDFEADWSPEGRQVAVSGVRFAGDRRYHFWVIDVRTHAMRKLADNVLPPRPSWSPDGRRIAYAAESGLGVVRIGDGATTTLRRAGRAEIGEVAWSPSGGWIAFTARKVPLD